MPAPTSPDASSLQITGERTVPGVPDENYWFQRHVVAYELAAAKADGLRPCEAWYDRVRHVFLIGEAAKAFETHIDGRLPFTRSGGSSSSRNTARLCAAKASFNSMSSKSAIAIPLFVNSRLVAKAGPNPMR